MKIQDEIKNMLTSADNYILNNPCILEKNVDEIFDELADSSVEMQSVRWGVMVRRKMMSLNSSSEKDVVDFLLSVSENNLLVDYIGYVLQEERNINLLKITVAAEKNDRNIDLLRFVIPNIKYLENIKMDDVFLLLDFFENNRKHRHLQQLLSELSLVILKCEKEDDILKKYMDEPAYAIQTLVYYIGMELCQEQINKAKYWICLFLNQRSRIFVESALDLLSRSLFYEIACYEKNIDDITQLSQNDDEYFIRLIPSFVNYLEKYKEGQYRDKITNCLVNVINGSQEIKRKFAQTIQYTDLKSDECTQILEGFLSVPFEKDEQILKNLDRNIAVIAHNDIIKGLRVIYLVYEINGYVLGDNFFDLMPNTCRVLKKNTHVVCDRAINGILNGDLKTFGFNIKIYEKLLSVADICSSVEDKNLSENSIIEIINGILFFTFSPKKMCRLIFELVKNMEVTDKFIEMCKKDIYKNYPSTFVSVSEEHRESKNEKQKKLAEIILDMDEQEKAKMKLSYENKELMPSNKRLLLYQKEKIKETKRIYDEATRKSFFSRYFPKQVMKYGKRYAFVQIGNKGQYFYQVSAHQGIKSELELLKEAENDPIEFSRRRNEYLRSRCNSETDN